MLRRTFVRAGAAAGVLCPICAALGVAQPAAAQNLPAGIKATQLLKTTVTGNDAMEAITLAVEFAPGTTTGRHFHFGDEYATVLEGAVELHQDGRPVASMAANSAYHNDAKLIHETRNVGSAPAKVIAMFIVEKGKPLVNKVT